MAPPSDSHTCEQLKDTVSFLLPFRHNKNNPFLPADLEANASLAPAARHLQERAVGLLGRAVQLTPRPRGGLGGGNAHPLQHSCLESPTGGEAWRATVHAVAKSWVRVSD